MLFRRTLLAAIPVAVLMTTSPASAGCPPTPRDPGECGALRQTSLSIDAYGQVEWRASRGPSTSADDFVADDVYYQLCVWDAERLVVAADIPVNAECRGQSCWTAEDSNRRYEDDIGANGDIRLLDFTGSDADRTRLHATTMVIGGINLPIIGGAIVQLVRTDTGACLESFVPAEAFTVDDKAAFAAKFTAPDSQ